MRRVIVGPEVRTIRPLDQALVVASHASAAGQRDGRCQCPSFWLPIFVIPKMVEINLENFAALLHCGMAKRASRQAVLLRRFELG
jgi:hypothetical protein